MKSSRPFNRTADKVFRPAFSYLNSLASGNPGTAGSLGNSGNPPSPRNGHASRHARPARHAYKDSTGSLDDTDHSDVEQYAHMDGPRTSHSSKTSLSELQPAVPLIDLSSRSASPYPRSRSAVQSEDEDDDFEPADSIRPLVSNDVGSGGSLRRGVWREGGLGGFFFGTWMGWQVYVALLVFWVGGCGFGLLLMNRFIMLTGVYKFPFPLTGTYVQLLLTHILLVGFSSLTRGLANPLRRLGLGAAVAPAYPVAPTGSSFRNSNKPQSSLLRIGRWLTNGSGGIAGGGLFEFDWQVAKQVLPLAVVFCFKILLSNISFA